MKKKLSILDQLEFRLAELNVQIHDFQRNIIKLSEEYNVTLEKIEEIKRPAAGFKIPKKKNIKKHLTFDKK